MAVQPELHLNAHQLAVNLLKSGAPPAGGVGCGWRWGGAWQNGGVAMGALQGQQARAEQLDRLGHAPRGCEGQSGCAATQTKQAQHTQHGRLPHSGSWCQQRSARRRYGSGQSSRNSGRNAPSAVLGSSGGAVALSWHSAAEPGWNNSITNRPYINQRLHGCCRAPQQRRRQAKAPDTPRQIWPSNKPSYGSVQ